jgi:nucleoside-diphosphate-sugar epimerase
MRTALVCGAGGFIGGHLVKRLKAEGFWVRGADLKRHEFAASPADDFLVGDLRDPYFCRQAIDRPHILFLLGMHVSGPQPDGSRFAELRGKFGIPGGAGQRIRLGKAFQ